MIVVLAAAAAAAVGLSALAVPPDVAEHAAASTSTSASAPRVAGSGALAPGEAESTGGPAGALASDSDGIRAKLVAARARYLRVLSGASQRAQDIDESAAANARELQRLVSELMAELPSTNSVHAASEASEEEEATASAPKPSPTTLPTTMPLEAINAPSPMMPTVWIQRQRVEVLRQKLLREAVDWHLRISERSGDFVGVDAWTLERLSELEGALGIDVNPDTKDTKKGAR